MAPPSVDHMITLKVDNVPFEITYGEIGDIYIPRARGSSDSRGFAFVRFINKQDADAAIAEMEGYEFQGRELHVQFARQRRPDNPREFYARRDGDNNRSRNDRDDRRRSRDRGSRDNRRDNGDDYGRGRGNDRDRGRYSSRSPDRRDRDKYRGRSRSRQRSRSPHRSRSFRRSRSN